ncbi:hypothetical protein BJF93_12815 [Xaviernesmea oryzae]|uniref:Uncharacterized protein n=1 Tax=Xaviernesmea oryzae TaxID=464029 RepID=A0A1Q9AQQ4_9HYPH|nr:hypothetical protein BJF93_12815 [Xaviernesmea oryzae]
MLIQAFSLTARSAAQAEDSVTITLAAGSIMDRLRLQPTIGQTPDFDGIDGAYRWTASVRALPIGEAGADEAGSGGDRLGRAPSGTPAQAMNPITLYKIDLDVQSPSGRHLQLASLLAKAE